MTTVSVASLKSRLSYFLDLVQRGEEVVVTSHRHPVGRLVAFAPEEGLHILPASRSPQTLRKIKGIRLSRSVDVVRLLREDRDRR